jgi:hypothetical protein
MASAAERCWRFSDSDGVATVVSENRETHARPGATIGEWKI